LRFYFVHGKKIIPIKFHLDSVVFFLEIGNSRGRN